MDALPQIQIVSITIDKGDGKVRPRAKLALAFPELLESWTLQQVFVRCHYYYYITPLIQYSNIYLQLLTETRMQV